MDSVAKLSADARAALEVAFDEAVALRAQWYGQHQRGAERTVYASRAVRDAALAVLDTDGPLAAPPEPILRGCDDHDGFWALHTSIRSFVAHPDVHVAHVIRFALLTGAGRPPTTQEPMDPAHHLQQLVARHREAHGGYDLREVGRAFELAGLPSDRLARMDLLCGWQGRLFSWPAESVASYYRDQLPVLEEILVAGPPPRGPMFSPRPLDVRQRVLDVLATLRPLPERMVEVVWPLALGNAKQLRASAQALLAELPDERIVAALSDRNQDVRANASRWLGARRAPRAIAAIRARLGREKKDVARAAMFDALEALGVPTAELVSREDVLRDARAAALPPALTWMSLEAFPELRFATDGAPAPRALIAHWLNKAHERKSPAANAELKRQAAMLAPADREALGLFVLDAWIAEDTRTASELSADRERELRDHAESWASVSTPTQTADELFAILRDRALAEPVGSAIAHKGVLALAAACGGEAIATRVEAYLKRWYGWRAAQCKALLQMLARLDDARAIQLLLSTATRFRTAGIKKEAEAQVQALAERKGWTVDELADRTIPTAGFDEEGRLELVYGNYVAASDAEIEASRTFVARIREDLRVEVVRPDGEIAATLPDPRRGEDASLAAAAKKTLARAKKELVAIAKRETVRLHEAMCAQRGTPFADWDRYLHRHPIVRHLVPAVVFTVGHDGHAMSFRPLGDGSLTDVDHAPVRPSDDAVVRVAHATTLGEPLASQWAAHLADYRVAPLFAQVGRPVYVLPEALAHAAANEDLEGVVLGSFALRNAAKHLGYERGPAGDGGWFHVYRKTMLGLGVDAVITHSGSPLPEEDRPIALVSVSFQHRSGGTLRLADVPPVLLSETMADARALAALGHHDPDWRKTVAV